MKNKQKFFSVAPMMDWTDRHCRYFHRLLTRKTVLYTEMVTSGAVVFGDRQHLIGFDEAEHPIALQLGGSDPKELSEACKIGQDFGYDQINLNIGCPSDRVKSGNFGAALMADPDLVGRCFASMAEAVNIPVTVKCRIGIDNQDEDKDLDRFVSTVSNAGCTTFIVHARKAWLKGLSPKENRDIPPLNYNRVYRLKENRPDLQIHINGGIADLAEARKHLKFVDGVMMGRAAYHQPFLLARVDGEIFGEENTFSSRGDVIKSIVPYIEQQLAKGVKLTQITRHLLGLFHAQPGARQWRRYLAENAHLSESGVEVLTASLEHLTDPARQFSAINN